MSGLTIQCLNPGKDELELFLLSDSYVGVDPEEDFDVDTAEGMHENEDEDHDNECIVFSFGNRVDRRREGAIGRL